MINISLPLRPRLTSQAETLTTALSVFLAEGLSILSITNINNTDKNNLSLYQDLIFTKIGFFDYTFIDNQPDFINTLLLIVPFLKLHINIEKLLVCNCGKFEEVSGIRMYNQRRIKNYHCTYCGSEIFEKTVPVLNLDINWNILIESFNREWLKKDYIHFIGRERTFYKISKSSESVKFYFNSQEFGLKHQILWACAIVYIAKMYQDNNISLHFVERVSNISFLCSVIAKNFMPELKIHLYGLPTIWLNDKKNIVDITSYDIEKLKKGLSSSRKEVRI